MTRMQQPNQTSMRNISGDADRRTVILLGASNLARGLSVVSETARIHFGSPIDIVAALGHGRSYGTSSRILLRALPGILNCGLWKAIDNIPKYRTRRPIALITDIGNDIIYGRPVSQMLDWINTSVERLSAHDAEIVITSLPIEAIQGVPRWQARLVKSIAYPGRGFDLEAAIADAVEVDKGVRALAAERNLHLIELQPDWYGFDPIHIRKRDWPRAAAAMFAPLNRQNRETTESSIQPLAKGSLSRWFRLRTALAEHVRYAGISCGQSQPARALPDGGTLSLY